MPFVFRWRAGLPWRWPCYIVFKLSAGVEQLPRHQAVQLSCVGWEGRPAVRLTGFRGLTTPAPSSAAGSDAAGSACVVNGLGRACLSAAESTSIFSQRAHVVRDFRRGDVPTVPSMRTTTFGRRATDTGTALFSIFSSRKSSEGIRFLFLLRGCQPHAGTPSLITWPRSISACSISAAVAPAPLPLFPRKRNALDQVRDRLRRRPPRPFRRRRQQTRRDQVNETQLEVRDLTRPREGSSWCRPDRPARSSRPGGAIPAGPRPRRAL